MENLEFGFIYKICSIDRAALNGLLKVAEFQNSILDCMHKNITINDKAVFNIVERLYFEFKKNRYDIEYKQNVIKTGGIEAWNDYKKAYHLIASGYHDVEKLNMKADPYCFDFMYNKISVPTSVMVSWLKSAIFVDEIKVLIDNNITINNKEVYNVVKKIYFPIKKQRDIDGVRPEKERDLNHSNARRGLRILSEKLYGDEKFWEKEYQDFLNS